MVASKKQKSVKTIKQISEAKVPIVDLSDSTTSLLAAKKELKNSLNLDPSSSTSSILAEASTQLTPEEIEQAADAANDIKTHEQV